MERKKIADNARNKRHKRLRQKVVGSAVRPRLCVFRSLKHIYAQLIDDENGRTLVGVSSLSPEIKETVTYGGNIKAAQEVGKLIAKKALEQDITQIVFDRGGYQYHGRVAALAKEVRESGIKF